MEANNVSGSLLKKAKKTGTTIAGIIFKVYRIIGAGSDPWSIDLTQFQDGVILGADTRATEGPIVADKNCEKIHYLAPNIFCGGAGTSADCENVTGCYGLLGCSQL